MSATNPCWLAPALQGINDLLQVKVNFHEDNFLPLDRHVGPPWRNAKCNGSTKRLHPFIGLCAFHGYFVVIKERTHDRRAASRMRAQERDVVPAKLERAVVMAKAGSAQFGMLLRSLRAPLQEEIQNIPAALLHCNRNPAKLIGQNKGKLSQLKQGRPIQVRHRREIKVGEDIGMRSYQLLIVLRLAETLM